jgi:hypothetical protein
MGLKVKSGTPIVAQESKAMIAPGAPTGAMLGVPFYRQEQTNWCWAGCSQMVLVFFGIGNIRQCDMASTEFGANCCATPSSATCNQGGWPENVLTRAGCHAPRQNGQVNRFSVEAAFAAGRPIIVYYAWNGGGAHVAVVRGIYDNGDLEVNDPWYGPGRRTFAAVQSGYGMGSWTMTYPGIWR